MINLIKFSKLYGMIILLSQFNNDAYSQQSTTLKLSFSFLDNEGKKITPNDSNYFYIESMQGKKIGLYTTNDHIKYDTLNGTYTLLIQAGRYHPYNFSFMNTNTNETMNFTFNLNGDFLEFLLIDTIIFTPGNYVFNLTNGVKFYNKSNLKYSDCENNIDNENQPCFKVENIDWKAEHYKKK